MPETTTNNPTAVTAIIYNPEDPKYILGVSRKDDHTKMGLPGGSIEPGETSLEAIIREVKEETGLDTIKARSVFVAPCKSSKNGSVIGHVVECFELEVQGETSSTEEGLVRWCSWNEDMFKGPYAEYNQKLYFEAKIYEKENYRRIKSMMPNNK